MTRFRVTIEANIDNCSDAMAFSDKHILDAFLADRDAWLLLDIQRLPEPVREGQ